MMSELWTQLGQVLLQRGRRIEARIAFGRALAIAPHAHNAMLRLAQVNSELGDYRAAADCYRQGLVNRPDDTSLWLKLGHCLLALGERDAGYDCFRTAARGGPAQAGRALTSLVKSGRGRFWLRPSEAARFFGSQT
jgi:tetratricopeptide (TPR) repeat protein